MMESLVVLGLGILSIVEGVRLTYMEHIQMYDVLGPGTYNAGVGVLLVVISVVYAVSFRGERQKKEGADPGKSQFKQQMVVMFATLGMYITLIHFVGYLSATLVFFLLMNRVVGFRSWWANGSMSLAVSMAFYLLFVHGLDMIFPKGALLEWIGGGF
jgi:putative tricarboxylic transport membrane protein